MADWILGALQEQLRQVLHTQDHHGEMLDEIRDLLQRQRLEPPSKEPRVLDWSKLLPRIWWGLLVLALAAAQALFPGAEKIASLLLSKL